MAQNLKTTLKSSSFYNDLDYYMIEALEMIATKQGRILAGNAREKEHWRDIAGYALLVVNEIDRAEREQLMDRAMSSVRVEEPNDQQPTE
jgi:SAM-dependent MidA family methyltransferase